MKHTHNPFCSESKECLYHSVNFWLNKKLPTEKFIPGKYTKKQIERAERCFPGFKFKC